MDNNSKRLKENWRSGWGWGAAAGITMGTLLIGARAQALQTINLALPSKSIQMVLYPIAQEQGYMREEGLEVKTMVVKAGLSIQALSAGSFHFSMAGTSALVAITKEIPLKVVLATNDKVLQWILSKQEIATPPALKGKRIGTSGVSSVATLMTKQVLAKYGLDPERDAVYIDLGLNRLPALKAGTVDAIILDITDRYLARAAGFRDLIYLGAELKNSWGTLATTDRLIREQPRLVQGFIKAALKGLRLFRQEREKAIATVARFSGIDRALAARMYDDVLSSFTRDGTVDEETQANDLTIIRQVSGVTEPIPISHAFDFRFAREADRQLNQAGWRP